MFRMASAIARNPDKEFEMKPPPLEARVRDDTGPYMMKSLSSISDSALESFEPGVISSGCA